MATLGRSGDAALAERFARALAAELEAVGITLDYAPVLDIHTNPKNPVIGDRALAEKAEDVARLGARDHPDAAGARASPPAASTFPGHGDTSTDSHLELPLVEHPPDRLRAVEFVPFRAAIEAGVAVDHDRARAGAGARRGAAGDAVAGASSPTCCATSSAIEGVILSDDLEMKAIAAAIRRAGGGGAGDRGRLRRRADLQRRPRRRRRRRSRRWFTPSRTERLPFSARRGRADAAAAREGALPRRAGRGRGRSRGAGAAAGARPRRASARSPTRWRASL